MLENETISIEEQLINALRKKNLTITTAESCTGGMISSALVNVPGASFVLCEAHVTYANEAKEKILGVSHRTLEEKGAVSEETAYEMVAGAAKIANADCAIAVTGTAGPDGGTEQKPVGTVYAGYYYKGKITVKRYQFSGNRYDVRRQTTEKTLETMLCILEKDGK